MAEPAGVLGLDTEIAVGAYEAARANLRAVLEGARIWSVSIRALPSMSIPERNRVPSPRGAR